MSSRNCLEEIYSWVDKIPLSRRKKNISRDFSDAVLLAEILKHFFPKLVDLHNYSPVNSKSSKIGNWNTLNRKVLKKLNIPISNKMVTELAMAIPGAAEELLYKIRSYIDSHSEESMSVSATSELDDNMDPVQTQENIIALNKMLDDYKQELLEKEEIINSLKTDVEHLNDLIKLKDQRISDLTMQIKRFHSNSSDIEITSHHIGIHF